MRLEHHRGNDAVLGGAVLSEDSACDQVLDRARYLRASRERVTLEAVLAEIPDAAHRPAVVDTAIVELLEASSADGLSLEEAADRLARESPAFREAINLAVVLRRSGLDATSLLQGRPPVSWALPRPFGPEWLPGTPRYLLIERILGGTTAVTYRALDRARSDDHRCEQVALKMVPKAERMWMRDEAARIARIDHSGVARVLDSGEHEDWFYVTTSWVDGETLRTWAPRESPSPKAAAQLALALSEAVDAVHRSGVRHLDLHPGNILVTPLQRIVLIDFGSGRGPFDEGKNYGVGALGFMAPELLALGGKSGVTSDVYALGAVLFWMLTQTFANGSTSEQAADYLALAGHTTADRNLREGQSDVLRIVDSDLSAIVLKCLSPGIADRFQTAGALAEDLRRWLRHEPLHWQRTSPMRRVALAWKRTSRASRAVLVGSLVAVVGSLAVAGWFAIDSIRREADRADAAASAARSAASANELSQEQQAQIRSVASAMRAVLNAKPDTHTAEWLPVLVAFRELEPRGILDDDLMRFLSAKRERVINQAAGLAWKTPTTSLEQGLIAAARGTWLLEYVDADENGPHPIPPPEVSDALALKQLVWARSVLASRLDLSDPLFNAIDARIAAAKVLVSSGSDTEAVKDLREFEATGMRLPRLISQRLSGYLAMQGETAAAPR